MHTSNQRWRGADATAPDVGALARTLLEQVHAQIGANAIVAAPPQCRGWTTYLHSTATTKPSATRVA